MAFANQSRIEQTVEALAQFNATPGAGITRLSYTTEYRAAQAYLKQELEAAGLSVRLDPIGNLIGRKEGIDRSLAAIAVGSHLDSVRNGGKYDGAAHYGQHNEQRGLQTQRTVAGLPDVSPAFFPCFPFCFWYTCGTGSYPVSRS